MSDIVERITAYLSLGGLFNPELADHDAVRDMIIDCRGEITALRAEIARLRVENIQMQAALGYGILAEDERHIIPSNPYKCGTCDARRAEVERLKAELHTASDMNAVYEGRLQKEEAEIERLRAALEVIAKKARGVGLASYARAALGGTDDT